MSTVAKFKNFKGAQVKKLFLDGEEEDLGEVFDLSEVSDMQLRIAVFAWLEGTPGSPFNYIIKAKDGFRLVGLSGDFEIRNGNGKVLEQK